MIKFLKNLGGTLFGASLDFRVRLFNIHASAGILICFYVGILGIFIGAGLVNLILCMITMALSAALLRYSFISKKYQLCYTITVICIFLILLPALFFSAGGYRSGMPSFFVFAVLFTVFMLEGKKMIVMSFLEIIVYISICVFAYYNPDKINNFNTDADVLTDIITGFTVASAALGITLSLHLKLHNQKQKELEAAHRQVEEYAKMKSRLFAGMSHEMRTPLTVMSAYAQFAVEQIRESGANEKTLSDLAAISDEAKRLAEMADGVLKVLMTGYESGGTGAKKNLPVDTAALITRLIRLLEPVALNKKIKLRLLTDKNISEIKGDADSFTQLMWNLLQNAITHSHGENVTVNIETYKSGVKIIISDDGDGIDSSILPHVFDRGVSGKKNGSGIGLSICREIVTQYGGDILLQSEKGKGTTVTLSLREFK